MLISLNWLKEIKNSAMFYLLQTDQLVTKIDGLLLLDIHSTSIPIGKYLHTLGSRERNLHENSATSKMIDERTI